MARVAFSSPVDEPGRRASRDGFELVGSARRQQCDRRAGRRSEPSVQRADGTLLEIQRGGPRQTGQMGGLGLNEGSVNLLQLFCEAAGFTRLHKMCRKLRVLENPLALHIYFALLFVG